MIKKITKLLLVLVASMVVTGCSFMAGVDAPEWLEIVTTSRTDLNLYWAPVDGATEYVVNTSAPGESWEPFKVEASKVEVVTDKGERVCYLNLSSTNISYDMLYTISVKAKGPSGIYGSSSEKVQFSITYVDTYNNHLSASRYEDNITVKWNNLDHGTGNKHQYGGLGIRYALYKQEGTIVIKSAMKAFQPDEGYEKGVLVSADFIPSSDYANEEFTYVDKDIKQEKSYRYFVIPYNKYNWISDNALTIKTYYSLVDWIE